MLNMSGNAFGQGCLQSFASILAARHQDAQHGALEMLWAPAAWQRSGKCYRQEHGWVEEVVGVTACPIPTIISMCTLSLISTPPSSLWFRFGLQRGKGEPLSWFFTVSEARENTRIGQFWTQPPSQATCSWNFACTGWRWQENIMVSCIFWKHALVHACTHTLRVPFLQPGVSLQTPQWDEGGAGRESGAITLVSSLQDRNSKFCQNLLL